MDKTVALFDFDNTLIKSNACLQVRDLKGDVVARFYNDSFRNYTLQDNEYLDFEAFEDPVSLQMYKELPAINIYIDYLKDPEAEVVILTSRSHEEVVMNFLTELGYPPDRVIGVNNPKYQFPENIKTNAQKKKHIVEQEYVLKGYKDFIYYDDDLANLSSVGSIENINIKTILS